MRQLGNGRVDPVAGRRDVEAAQRGPDQRAGRERHDAGGGGQLAQHGEPGAALGGVLVGACARDGEDGGVLDLVGERLGPGAGVLAGGVLSVLDELVRHGQCEVELPKPALRPVSWQWADMVRLLSVGQVRTVRARRSPGPGAPHPQHRSTIAQMKTDFISL
ncbi:hypothetical protein [Kitasatospora acidiphila]|uniref:hypothetical protein n=1 Tax=Kitasatospora acidiphila TaxID=2567942 RepID=UPI001E46E446|nr:hypothetical protein [Kitasatospora acidiphila]